MSDNTSDIQPDSSTCSSEEKSKCAIPEKVGHVLEDYN